VVICVPARHIHSHSSIIHRQDYDQAVKLLVDLRDLAVRKGKTDEFEARLNAFRAAQARKPSFIERLRKAKL
jgi:hypothetical protein